jgi:hypothetical protein
MLSCTTLNSSAWCSFRSLDLRIGAAAGELQDLERARRVEPFDVLGIDQGGCRNAAAPRGTTGLVDPSTSAPSC